MKPEQRLQENIIKTLKDLQVKALHLSPPSHPGFPDLLCTYVNKFLMVELKVATHVGDQLFQSMFTRSQLPWIYNWLSDDQSPILVITECQDAYYSTIFHTKDDVVKALRLTTKEVFELPISNKLSSIGEVCECIFLTLAMDFDEIMDLEDGYNDL